jgi:hypothetical protein
MKTSFAVALTANCFLVVRGTQKANDKRAFTLREDFIVWVL